MQHERIRPTGQQAGSENVGDVLASIRRLIAQDQTPAAAGLRPRLAHPAQPGTAFDPPFVLARQDMVAGLPRGTAAAQPHLSLASSAAPVQPLAQPLAEAPTGWQPAPLRDWPQTGVAAATSDSPALAQPLAEAACDDASAPLSPEEEAEFAEAEAALARMIAPRPTEALQTPQPPAPAEQLTPTEEPAMAQDMRMMEMGRIDDFTAVAPQPGLDSGLDARRGTTTNAPNLFGEIGAVAKDATMRMLIRDAIQQELHGELGARLSRNMCQMIRQEVEAVIREICTEQ